MSATGRATCFTTNMRTIVHRSLFAAALLAAPLHAQLQSLTGTFLRDGKTYTFTWRGTDVVLSEGEREVARLAMPTQGVVRLADEQGQALAMLNRFGSALVVDALVPASRASLGVSVEAPSEALAEHLGLDRNATLLVREVTEGGPAHKAGLRRSDIITVLDGAGGADHAGLQRVLAGKKPGDVLRLSILRKGVVSNLDVVLGAEPILNTELRYADRVGRISGDWAGAFGSEPLTWDSRGLLQRLMDDESGGWGRLYGSHEGTLRTLFDRAQRTPPTQLQTADVLKELDQRLAELEATLAKLRATKAAEPPSDKPASK